MKKKIIFILLVLSIMISALACKEVKFELNFMVGDEVYSTISTSGEETIEMPQDPTEEGKVFLGWYWDKDTWQKPFTANSLLDAPLKKDMQVYARFDTDKTLANIVKADKFTIDGDKLKITVPNASTSFSFIDEIEVSPGATWQLCTDISGYGVIPTKTALLDEGDNIFYIFVTSADSNTIKLYEVTIRRRPLYTVAFNDGQGNVVSSQIVEEGGNVAIPTEKPVKTDYDFTGWDFDFTTAIDGNKEILAKYDPRIFKNTGSVITGLTDYAKENCTEIEIPSEIDGIEITSIGNKAFYMCSILTRAYIPSSVVSIGERAFYNCTSLTDITIPNSVTSIGSSAFTNCPIEKANIPTNAISYIKNSSLKEVIINGGKAIGDNAFQSCRRLTSITIPDSVTNIGASAFDGCSSLTSVTIPNSVTSIGDYAFYGCDNLEYNVENNLKYLGNEKNSYFLLVGVTTTNLSNYTINSNTKFIHASAFYNCTSLTSVTIPNNVISIGGSAFDGCSSLTSVTIPDSVTSIGGSAFYNCTDLTSITIPDGVTSIGGSAFYNCTDLTSITIPDEVTSIGDYSFYSCAGLTSIIIPNSVKSIGNSSFENCTHLTSVVIPSSMLNIGNNAFFNCPIEIANIPTVAIAYIKNSSLKEVTINGGDTIGNYILDDNDEFSGCSNLTSVIIPSSVTSIGVYAFKNCTSLTSVTIPSSVTDIWHFAFANCTSLTSITILNSATNIESSAFTNCPIEKANIPTNAISCIQNSSLKEVTINGGKNIGDRAFYDCSSLTGVTIPNGVTSIGDYAFYGCTSLTSVTIPDSVTSIGEYAFSHCTSLTSVTIPNSITNIEYMAFYDCSSLTSINIPDSVTSIGSYAFSYCDSLTSITIPDSVTSIGSYAFSFSDNKLTLFCEAYSKPNDWYDSSMSGCSVYWYRATNPNVSGNYWHYVNGVPTIW